MWAESKLHSPPIAVSFKESYDIFGELLFLHINKKKIIIIIIIIVTLCQRIE